MRVIVVELKPTGGNKGEIAFREVFSSKKVAWAYYETVMHHYKDCPLTRTRDFGSRYIIQHWGIGWKEPGCLCAEIEAEKKRNLIEEFA